MKIVHEIYGIPTMTMTVREMSSSSEKRPDWNGAYVDLMVCSGPSPIKESEDAIFIEGTIESVREMCNGLLEQLDFMEKEAMGRVEELRQASKKCEVCDRWYDTRHPGGHGNGKGDRCLGDGTLLIGNLNCEVIRPAHRVCYVEHLKVGEVFMKVPDSAFCFDKFEVIEAPVTRRASWEVRVRVVS